MTCDWIYIEMNNFHISIECIQRDVRWTQTISLKLQLKSNNQTIMWNHFIEFVSNRNRGVIWYPAANFPNVVRLKIQYLSFVSTSEIYIRTILIFQCDETLIGCGSHYCIQYTTQSMISLSLQTSCTYIDQQHHIVRWKQSASQPLSHTEWSRLKLKMNEFPISQ